MPIRITKNKKSISCDEFIEYDKTNTPNEASLNKYRFYKDKGANGTFVYKIYRGWLYENSDAEEIVLDRYNETLTAKELIENSGATIIRQNLRSITPIFYLEDRRIFIYNRTLEMYAQNGVRPEDLIIGIQVKHATFSRGRYKKPKKKDRRYHLQSTKNKRSWKELRMNDPQHRSPYQLGYQHSGSQFRKHSKAIKNNKKYRLITRPQKYFYGDDDKYSFSYLTIGVKDNNFGEVIITSPTGEQIENVYRYFMEHRISVEDLGGKKVNTKKWLKYRFVVKTRMHGTLQTSEFFKVYYEPDGRTATNIEFPKS